MEYSQLCESEDRGECFVRDYESHLVVMDIQYSGEALLGVGACV